MSDHDRDHQDNHMFSRKAHLVVWNLWVLGDFETAACWDDAKQKNPYTPPGRCFEFTLDISIVTKKVCSFLNADFIHSNAHLKNPHNIAWRINRYDKVVLHDMGLDTKLQTQQTIWWSDEHILSSLPLISFFFFWGFCDS